jgi:tripartite-type tricarboxylate transporter receptor subunit TctC
LGQIRAGKLRLLGLSSAERAPLFPEVPTFREAGYPGLVAGFWTGLLCPAGTPPEQVARLNAAANRAMESAPIRERLAGEALRPISGPPELLREQIAQDRSQWGRLIREKNITLE